MGGGPTSTKKTKEKKKKKEKKKECFLKQYPPAAGVGTCNTALGRLDFPGLRVAVKFPRMRRTHLVQIGQCVAKVFEDGKSYSGKGDGQEPQASLLLAPRAGLRCCWRLAP
jgi:hypothetical protein